MFTRAETTILTDSLQQLAATTGETNPKTKDYRERWLEKMEFLTSIATYDKSLILLHDTSVNRFLFMSDKAKTLGGYNPADFITETGMDYSFSNIHSEQRSAALLIQLKIISYGFEHMSSAENNVVANMMFQYKKKGGGYIQLLQKVMAVETDAEGHPLLYLRFGYDISHLVKPAVGLIINAPDETLIWTYNTNKKCLEQINLLSAQEKKILALLAEGKGSKEIADMLFASSHTVDTHRRNLLKKNQLY